MQEKQEDSFTIKVPSVKKIKREAILLLLLHTKLPVDSVSRALGFQQQSVATSTHRSGGWLSVREEKRAHRGLARFPGVALVVALLAAARVAARRGDGGGRSTRHHDCAPSPCPSVWGAGTATHG